jgi:phosphatidylglycerophosphatase C
MNSKKLLLLDFDGTITTKDTFPLFIKFDKGFLVYFAVFSLFSPLLILYKLKLVDGGRVKQSILSFLYKNYSKDNYLKKELILLLI